MAFAVFAARPHSHPFQERKVSLKEPSKVGRAVAKCKSSQNNLIFDCKVLSRSHAIIWYENGKFLIQDTKSSNGTYVNSVQVGRNGDDSEAVELRSGDVVQFGVDVTENSKKVTHGCIIAVVTLVNPDGTEAVGETAKPVGRILPLVDGEHKFNAKELWQLSKYIQDAMNREQLLEQKLATMQRMIADSSTSSDEAFQAFVKEDQLLSRLDMLENELDVITKDLPEDDNRKLLISFQEEKEHYESKAKESIQRLIEEKSDTLLKLADVQRSLSYSEDECAHLKSLYEKSEEDVKDLMDRNEQLLKEVKKSRDDLEIMESKYKLCEDEIIEERNKLKLNQEEAERRASTLAIQVESLQAECDFTKEQLSAMKEKLEKHQNDIANRPHEENQSKTDDDVNLQPTRVARVYGSLLLDIKKNLLEVKKNLRVMSPKLSDEETDEDDQQSSGISSIDGEPDLPTSLEHFSHLSKEINDELTLMSENKEKLEYDEERELRHQLQSAEAEVFKVQLQIDALNDNLLMEQQTSLKYKELAEQFEAKLALEESRRNQLIVTLDAMNSRLNDLQERIDKDDKVRLETITEDIISESVIHQLENENITAEELEAPETLAEVSTEQSTSDAGTLSFAHHENDSGDSSLTHQKKEHRNIQSAKPEDDRTFNLLLCLVAVLVAIGAAYLLDVFNVSLGNSPIFDRKTWRELYEQFF